MRAEELAERLVVKRSANGRCTYDEEAKRELVEACLQPGASIAKIARDYGVNANLLHTWISLDRKERGGAMIAASPLLQEPLAAAFVVCNRQSQVDLAG